VAALYADENVAQELVDRLRALGHDMLTARDDGRAGQGIDDPDVLSRAIELGRAVLTNNRKDYHRLHRTTLAHAGIVTYTRDDHDLPGLAVRIDAAIAALPSLAGQCVRVIRPNQRRKP
jgi:hypothetical protein